jgi:hypothetical protein
MEVSDVKVSGNWVDIRESDAQGDGLLRTGVVPFNRTTSELAAMAVVVIDQV